MQEKTLKYVHEVLLEIDPTLHQPQRRETYEAAIVLVSAQCVGVNVNVLANFTQLPQDFIAAICQRMISAEIWTESDASCEWLVEPGVLDQVRFWLEVLVAQGRVSRQWIEDEGNYRYCSQEIKERLH